MNSLLPQDAPQLTIGRWVATYHVPRDGDDARDVRSRVDHLLETQLAGECSSCLQDVLGASDPAVWRIKDLSVNLSMELSSSDEQGIAVHWARHLATEILSAVEFGEKSDSVTYFPNRAAYLARFCADLCAGRARGKWYYEEFEELYVLTDAQAACSIFLRGECSSVELLGELVSMGALESVLSAVSEDQARIIYDSCFADQLALPSSEALDKWTAIVLQIWNSGPLRAAIPRDDHFRDALRLFARVLSQHPSSDSDGSLKASIDGLLDFRRLLGLNSSPRWMDTLIKVLARGELSVACALAAEAGAANPQSTPATLAFFAERMKGEPNWGAQAAAVILGESQQQKFLTANTFSPGESFLSVLGGIFLLGPTLEAFRLEELAAMAAQNRESADRVAAVLRHFAAVKCLGMVRAIDSADDPALRLFSGFEGASFRAALENVDATNLDVRSLERVLLQILHERYELQRPVLFADLVSNSELGSPVAILLRDLLLDEWLTLTPITAATSDLARLLESSLADLCTSWNLGDSSVLLSELLARSLGASELRHAGQTVVLSRDDESLQSETASQLGLTRDQFAVRLSAGQRHYPYFCTPEVWMGSPLAPHLDCTFTLLARATLKYFSRKLLSFESSSPEYLYQNFLSGLSTIRRTDDHYEICLPVSPLSIVLRMAGLQEQKYAPSWLKGREVWLVPPQG